MRPSSSTILPWILAVCVFVLPGLCRAELYMYRDRNGSVHFTDKLENVPLDRRSGVKVLEESETEATEADATQKESAETESMPAEEEGTAHTKEKAGRPEAAPAQDPEKTDTDEKDQARLEGLMALKEDIEKERASVEQEQYEIMNKIQTIRLEREIRNLNRDMIDVNNRVAEGQRKWNAFAEKWEAYHDKSKDSSDYQRLKETRSALEIENFQINEEMDDLLKRGRSIRTNFAARGYKNKMKELKDRLVMFRNNRDAYEKEWDAFYSTP